MTYYGASAPQLPDADLMGMIQQAAGQLMQQNNEHPQIASMVLQEIVREVPRIQSELRYTQSPDGTVKYSDIQQKVGQYLGMMIPQIKQRMMPQQPPMGMPMYPQQAMPMQQPMYGPPMMQHQVQQPYGVQDPYRSTIQQPHQTNVFPTTHAAKLINDAHSRVQSNPSIFTQAPPPVSSYNTNQTTQQVVPNLFPSKDEQSKIEAKNTTTPVKTSKIFPIQLIKEITTGEYDDDNTDKVDIIEDDVKVTNLPKSTITFNTKLMSCNSTKMLVGRGKYAYPCISHNNAFSVLSRMIPEAFSKKQDYFIEITYPQLQAVYLGGMEITDTTIEKIHKLFDSLADLRDALNKDRIMSALTLSNELTNLLTPDKIDYPIGQYIRRYVISECLKRTRFTLVEHGSPCELMSYEELEDLQSIQNFYRSPSFPQQLKNRWKGYQDIIHNHVHEAITSVLDGLLYIPPNNYDNLQLPGEYDFHWSTYIKHPNVSSITDNNSTLDDKLTTEEQIEEIQNSLNKYFFHLTPKTVLFTNAKEHGLELEYMGNIINRPRKYAHQFISNSLNDLDHKGDSLDYCITNDFGVITQHYTINRMLSTAILCLKHTTF